MDCINNVINESCLFELLFLKENHFQSKKVEFWTSKLTLNFENALFLSGCHSFMVQDSKVSFEYVDSYAKMLLILHPASKNSTPMR